MIFARVWRDVPSAAGRSRTVARPLDGFTLFGLIVHMNEQPPQTQPLAYATPTGRRRGPSIGRGPCIFVGFVAVLIGGYGVGYLECWWKFAPKSNQDDLPLGIACCVIALTLFSLAVYLFRKAGRASRPPE